MGDGKSIFDAAYWLFFGLGGLDKNISKCRENLNILVGGGGEGKVAAWLGLVLLDIYSGMKWVLASLKELR